MPHTTIRFHTRKSPILLLPATAANLLALLLSVSLCLCLSVSVSVSLPLSLCLSPFHHLSLSSTSLCLPSTALSLCPLQNERGRERTGAWRGWRRSGRRGHHHVWFPEFDHCLKGGWIGKPVSSNNEFITSTTTAATAAARATAATGARTAVPRRFRRGSGNIKQLAAACHNG